MTDKEWRLQVMGGGEWCEIDGETLVEIDPHHYIKKSQCSKLRTEIRNGVRICRKHHIQAHKDPKWFAKELQRIRPADKKFCDDVLREDNLIKESK